MEEDNKAEKEEEVDEEERRDEVDEGGRVGMKVEAAERDGGASWHSMVVVYSGGTVGKGEGGGDLRGGGARLAFLCGAPSWDEVIERTVRGGRGCEACR